MKTAFGFISAGFAVLTALATVAAPNLITPVVCMLCCWLSIELLGGRNED